MINRGIFIGRIPPVIIILILMKGSKCPKIKNPRLKTGGPNQKPLTIKPYPMKIHC
jgi:hypothetical protein